MPKRMTFRKFDFKPTKKKYSFQDTNETKDTSEFAFTIPMLRTVETTDQMGRSTLKPPYLKYSSSRDQREPEVENETRFGFNKHQFHFSFANPFTQSSPLTLNPFLFLNRYKEEQTDNQASFVRPFSREQNQVKSAVDPQEATAHASAPSSLSRFEMTSAYENKMVSSKESSSNAKNDVEAQAASTVNASRPVKEKFVTQEQSTETTEKDQSNGRDPNQNSMTVDETARDSDSFLNLLSGEQVRENHQVSADAPLESFTWTAQHTGTIELDFKHQSTNGLKVVVKDKSGDAMVNQIDFSHSAHYTIEVQAGAEYQFDVGTQVEGSLVEYDFSLQYGSNILETNYAILFSGGYNPANNHARYDNAMEAIYETLTTVYELNPKNIYVLYADGADNSVDLSDGTNSDLSYLDLTTPLYSATNANLQIAADDLLARIDANDHFLFWTFDHGFGTKNQAATFGEEGLNGWNPGNGTEELVNDEFILSEIQPIMETASNSTLVFGQCFAGGVLDEFQGVIDNINATPGKSSLGMSAANHFESSYASSFIDEFNIAFETYNSGMATYELAHDNDIYAVARGTYAPNTSTVAAQNGEEHPWVWPNDINPVYHQIMSNPYLSIPDLTDILEVPHFDLNELLLPFWEKYFVQIEFPIQELPPFPEPIPPCPVPFSFDLLQAAAMTGRDLNPTQPVQGFQIQTIEAGFTLYSVSSPIFLNAHDIINSPHTAGDSNQVFYNARNGQFDSLNEIRAAHKAAQTNDIANAAQTPAPQYIAVDTVGENDFIMPNDVLLIDRAEDQRGDAMTPFSVRAFNGETVSSQSIDVTFNPDANKKVIHLTIKEDEAIEDIVAQLEKDLGDVSLVSWGQPLRGSFQSNEDASFAFDYRPTNDYFGSDLFSVQYQDQNKEFGLAQINIEIESVNDAPIAISDEFNFSKNSDNEYQLNVINPKTFTTDYDPDHKTSELSIQLFDDQMNVVTELKQGKTTVLKVDSSGEYDTLMFTPTQNTPAELSFHYQLVDPDGLASNVASVEVELVGPGSLKEMEAKINTLLRENNIDLNDVLDVNNDQVVNTKDSKLVFMAVKEPIDVSNSNGVIPVTVPVNPALEEALFELINTTYDDEGQVYHLLDLNRDQQIDAAYDITLLHQVIAESDNADAIASNLAQALFDEVA